MASLLKWLGDAAHNVQKVIGDIGHNAQQGVQQANNFVARPVQQAVRAAAPVAQQVARASIPQIPKAPDFISELSKIRINPNQVRQAAIDTVNPKIPFTNARSLDAAQGAFDFVMPNTKPFIQKIIPTVQDPIYRGQYVASQLLKPFLKMQGIYNDPGFAQEYERQSLEKLAQADEFQKQGYTTKEIADGDIKEFAKQMFKVGVPVGLDIGSVVSGAQLAGVPLKKALIEGTKEVGLYGTGLLANKGLQNGKIELKDIPESYGTALANEVVGFGAGKVLGKITNKFKPNSIKEVPDFSAPISVTSLAEKGRLLSKGYTNIEVRVPQSARSSVNSKVAQDVPSYGMSHRPTEGPPAHDLLAKVDNDGFAPKDIYDRPELYGDGGSVADKESVSILKQIKGNPNAEITIYRASPSKDLNNGDWVSLSKSYAAQEALTEGVKVNSFKVKASDVKWAGDSLNEFGYYPAKVTTLNIKKEFTADQRAVLEGRMTPGELQNKIQSSTLGQFDQAINKRDFRTAQAINDSLPETNAYKATNQAIIDRYKGGAIAENAPENPILAEARKYKSAEEFVKAQGTPLYHGTKKELVNKIEKEGLKFGKSKAGDDTGMVWAANSESTARYFGKDAIVDMVLPKGAKIIDQYTKLSKEQAMKLAKYNPAQLYDPIVEGMPISKAIEQITYARNKSTPKNIIQTVVKDLGYDGYSGFGGTGILLNPKYAKTKTQLTDLYNQATKGNGVVDATTQLESALVKKYPGVDFSVYDNGRNINVSKIVVPKEARSTGIGTKAMKDIISEADAKGRTITLTPSSDYGGSKGRLVDFYKKLGFVENKGRTKDLAISEDMYKLPSQATKGRPINELAPKASPEALLKQAGYTQNKAGDWLDSKGKVADIGDIQTIIEPPKLRAAEQAVNTGKITIDQAENITKGKPIYETAPKPEKELTIYHGTTPEGYDSIMKNGFDPEKSISADSPGAVMFANKKGDAEVFSGQKVGAGNGKVIEAKINSDKVFTMTRDESNALIKKTSKELRDAGKTPLDEQQVIKAAHDKLFKKYDAIEVKNELGGSWYMIRDNNKIKIVDKTLDEGLKQRGISKSLQESGVSSKIYADIPGYKSVPNQTLLNISENRAILDEQKMVNAIKNRQSNQPITAQLQADSIYLLNKYVKEGRDEEALAIARATAKNSTEAGRAVQILSKLHATTPEGALVRAQKMVDLVNKKAKKTVATLTPENQAEITRLANEVQKYKQGTREWDVAAATLAKYVDELAPVGTLKKISSVQTMAQLLNPKTAIRNIIGNVGMAGAEDLSSVPATIADKVISKMAGTARTTAVANPIVRAKGTAKGLKYGYQDALAGIKTSGLEGKFEVQPDVFKKGVMKKLQTALSVELGAADKAFYTGQFDTSLDSIMRANKVTTATKDMLEQANQEALYSTFQNNSLIAQGLQKAKGAFNAGKDWGVGDLIIKYPKTPGNIVSVGLDYSPVGAFKGLKELAQNWSKLSPSIQRDAVKNIGRSITGTGAITLGYVLAKNNIITGKRDSDKDIANLDQQEGVGPFSFNFTALQRFLSGGSTEPQEGDVTANYDWMQPAAISLSMGANMAINQGKSVDNFLSDAIESVGDAANTITEQPVLKGIRDFSGNLDTSKGGGFGKATERLVSGIPASFVPSLVNQAGQLTDNTSRSRYAPGFVDEMINSVKARIPGARSTLQPVITTLGQEKEQYQDGSNNLFNVLLNPSFVKVLKGNPAYELVKGIQDRSGETTQAPRTAPYKVKINGEQRELQPAEYTQYQTYVGKKTNETYTRMAQDPQFSTLSDEEKAKKMSNVMSDINSAALIELFGNQPKTVSKDVKSIVATGTAQYTSEDPEVTKAKKVAISKAKSTKKKSTRGKKKGRKTKSGKKTVASIPNLVKSGMFKPGKITARSVSTRRLSTKSIPKVKSGKVYI